MGIAGQTSQKKPASRHSPNSLQYDFFIFFWVGVVVVEAKRRRKGVPLVGISNKAHDHGRGLDDSCMYNRLKIKVRKEGDGIRRDTVFSTESSGVVYQFDSFQLSMTTGIGME